MEIFMDKKKLWIIGGVIFILLMIIATLCWLAAQPSQNEFTPVSHTTANGGTVAPADKTAQSVALNDDGTSAGDALYEYKSKYGYSVQYNNKYIVDFGKTTYDFSIKNESDTVNVVIKDMPYDEAIASIQTKEEWDSLMGQMLGESLEFNRTVINNMDALIGHYSLDYGNGITSDVIFAMLIGNEYMYSYMYNAAVSAPQEEATQIGAILYTIKQI